jgi:hypothetical protein
MTGDKLSNAFCSLNQRDAGRGESWKRWNESVKEEPEDFYEHCNERSVSVKGEKFSDC